MPKSLGEKRKAISDEQVAEITHWYTDALQLATAGDPHVKVMNTTDFGYQRITVERPLRVRYQVTDVSEAGALSARPVAKLPDQDADAPLDRIRLRQALEAVTGVVTTNRADVEQQLRKAVVATGATISPALTKAVVDALVVSDPSAPAVVDRKGTLVPDPNRRENENVPLSESIAEYMQREVLPHVPDAWVDESKTKIGYEIGFIRQFFVYQPPRDLEEIDRDLRVLEERIAATLAQVTR
jgi:type I restriction enzyme M protein